MSPTSTLAPASVSRLAMPNPMPIAPPVTIAFLPVRSNGPQSAIVVSPCRADGQDRSGDRCAASRARVVSRVGVATPSCSGEQDEVELLKTVGVGDHVDPGDRVARDGDVP